MQIKSHIKFLLQKREERVGRTEDIVNHTREDVHCFCFCKFCFGFHVIRIVMSVQEQPLVVGCCAVKTYEARQAEKQKKGENQCVHLYKRSIKFRELKKGLIM